MLPIAQILSILAHVFLVVVIRSDGPVRINHILEKSDSMHDDGAGFLSVKTRKILNRLGVQNDLHQTSNASFLLLGLQENMMRIKQ